MEFPPEEVQEYHVEKVPKHESNSQRFCGCCITGPKDKATMPIIANIFMFVALASNAASLAYLWPDWKPLTIANLALGVISLILMWVVQFSDPGIQSPTKHREADVNENPGFDVNDTMLSFNAHEKAIWTGEEPDALAARVYEETPFYFYRYCTTCDIQRKPKASHCGTCNNCVVGYDHHCTLLNNCIGKRNLRAFNVLLVCVWTFALVTAAIAVMVILHKPVLEKLELEEGDEEAEIKFELELIVGITLAAVQVLKVCAFGCCKRCISFGVLILGVVVELLIVIIAGIVMAVLKAPQLTLAMPMISIGLSFGLVAWPLMKLHLELVANHLTEKEWDARMKTCAKLQIDDETIESITCGQKSKNVIRFFCGRKVPKSEVWD